MLERKEEENIVTRVNINFGDWLWCNTAPGQTLLFSVQSFSFQAVFQWSEHCGHTMTLPHAKNNRKRDSFIMIIVTDEQWKLTTSLVNVPLLAKQVLTRE